MKNGPSVAAMSDVSYGKNNWQITFASQVI